MPRSSPRPVAIEYFGPKDIKLHCETVYAFLMARRGGYPNDHALACMLSTLSGVPSGMTRRLGLSPARFSQMMAHHFPSATWPDSLLKQGDDLDASRTDERKQLIDLIWWHRWHDHASALWIAHIIAAGCMGKDHLWQDLGLWSRHDLSELIRRNFPALALRNNRDMKWKKFLYKQLCIQEGIYTCHTPSCDVCVDYTSCFGLEE